MYPILQTRPCGFQRWIHLVEQRSNFFGVSDKKGGGTTQMWSGWYMITIDHQWRASPIFSGGWNHQAVNELGSRESTRVSTRTSQDIRPLLVSYHVILCDMGVPKNDKFVVYQHLMDIFIGTMMSQHQNWGSSPSFSDKLISQLILYNLN